MIDYQVEVDNENGMLQATAFLLVSSVDDHFWGGPPSVVWNKVINDYYSEGQKLQEVMQYVWRFLCSEIDIVGSEIMKSYSNVIKEELLKNAAPQITLATYDSKSE